MRRGEKKRIKGAWSWCDSKCHVQFRKVRTSGERERSSTMKEIEIGDYSTSVVLLVVSCDCGLCRFREKGGMGIVVMAIRTYWNSGQWENPSGLEPYPATAAVRSSAARSSMECSSQSAVWPDIFKKEREKTPLFIIFPPTISMSLLFGFFFLLKTRKRVKQCRSPPPVHPPHTNSSILGYFYRWPLPVTTREVVHVA